MEINVGYKLPFPVADVYEAWVASDTVIPPATKMEIDPVVGGHYRLIMETETFRTKNEGRFSIVEPPHHVRYSWQWEGDDEITEVDVRFEAQGGGTAVRIHHFGFLRERSLNSHKTGWESYISGLKEHLSKR